MRGECSAPGCPNRAHAAHIDAAHRKPYCETHGRWLLRMYHLNSEDADMLRQRIFLAVCELAPLMDMPDAGTVNAMAALTNRPPTVSDGLNWYGGDA